MLLRLGIGRGSVAFKMFGMFMSFEYQNNINEY